MSTVLSILGRESVVVSDRGLRHGVLAERLALPRPATTLGRAEVG